MSRKRKRVFSLEDAEREVQEESEMMGQYSQHINILSTQKHYVNHVYFV